MTRIAVAALLVALLVVSHAMAEERSDCAAAPPALWGDGEHDDTAALNAWFRGETVIWAQTHEVVGSKIADRRFLLSATVYVHGGPDTKKEPVANHRAPPHQILLSRQTITARCH